MLRHLKIACVALSAVVAMVVPGRAQAFDTYAHSQLTMNALNAEGFSGDAIVVGQVFDWFPDLYHFTSASAMPASGHSKALERALLPQVSSENWSQGLINAATRSHFYGVPEMNAGEPVPGGARMPTLGTTQGEANEWDRLVRVVGTIARQARDENDPEKLIEIMGMSLHQVQDFYAHSNWVEPRANHGSVPGADGPGWAERGFGSNPTWFDVPAAARNEAKIYSADTIEYPGTLAPHRPHGDWNADNGTSLVHAMAKDSPARPLNAQAVMTAEFASRQWVRAMRLWVNDDVFWERAQRYHPANSTQRCELMHDLAGAHQIMFYSGQYMGEGEPEGGHASGPGGNLLNLSSAVSDYFSDTCDAPLSVPWSPKSAEEVRAKAHVKTRFRAAFERLILQMAARDPVGSIGSVPSSREIQRETRFVGLKITNMHADGIGDPGVLSRLATSGLFGNDADMYVNARVNDEPLSSAEINNEDDFSFPRPQAPFTWYDAVPVASEEQEPVESIEVEVKTSCDRWSGTDDDVFLRLGSGIKLHLDKDYTNDFERCDRDTYSAPIDDLVAPGIQDDNTAEIPVAPIGAAGNRTLRVGDIKEITMEKSSDGILGGAWKLDGLRVWVNGVEVEEQASIDRWLQDGHLTWKAPDFRRSDPRGSKVPVSIFIADDDGGGTLGISNYGIPLGDDDKGDLNGDDHNRVLTIGYSLGQKFCRNAEGGGKNGGRVGYEHGDKARVRYCLETVTPEPPPVEPPAPGSQPVARQAPPARPDLIISELTPNLVTVENLGAGDAGPFRLTAFNGDGEHTESFTGLAAGASATRPLSGISGCEAIEATVDDLEQVEESNEFNNGARTEEVDGGCPGVRPIPDVIGDGEALARQRIENAGFNAETRPKADLTCESIGRVIAQSPRGGSSADPGATVTISVGVRPSPPFQCK
jgi:hypothetical protein